MLNCNTMEYGVWVRALNKKTTVEIKVHYELEREILLKMHTSTVSDLLYEFYLSVLLESIGFLTL